MARPSAERTGGDAIAALVKAGGWLLPPALGGVRQLVRAALPYAWTRGPSYRRVLSLTAQAARWDDDQRAAAQLAGLRRVVSLAEASPAHRRRFAAAGVASSHLRTLEDIRRLPCMTKDELRADPDGFVREGIATDALVPMTTGGSTGRPVRFHHPAEAHDLFTAFCAGVWRGIGYAPGRRAVDVTASFPGEVLMDAQRRVLYVSIAALDDVPSSSLAARIAAFRPEFVIGFPSSAMMLARLLGSHAHRLRLRGVIVGSEMLHPWQRTQLTRSFGCRVLPWYGMAEYAAFAAGCAHGEGYHFTPVAGYVEVLDEDGAPVPEGMEGELVVTGFHATATPFIRYRTGDRAVRAPDGCVACAHRGQSVAAIRGRAQEFLVTARGGRLPVSALNLHDDTYAGVAGVQLHQREAGVVTVRLLPDVDFSAARAEAVREAFAARLGGGVRVEVSVVATLGQTARGKLPFVIQEMRGGWDAEPPRQQEAGCR